MSGITFLANDDPPSALPPAGRALVDPNGLLAVGGRLTPDWLRHAYPRGIFPWFSGGQPILWWSPDPRAVLFPDEFRQSRSLGQSIRNRGYRTTINQAFAEVIAACAAPRADEAGTWITDDMFEAYLQLHEQGDAHSIETWHEDRLVGGLYGVAIGRVFFGESMFAQMRDASKVALARLVSECSSRGVRLIDCQMASQHLSGLGSRSISRSDFLAQLAREAEPSCRLWQKSNA